MLACGHGSVDGDNYPCHSGRVALDGQDGSRLGVLRWQLQWAWSLAEYHLGALTDELCRWEPAPDSWTVRRGADGRWRPDWAEPEPEPVPGVTIGWVIWHLGWWWSAALDHAEGRTPPPREDVHWPGDAAAAVTWLRDLHSGWSGFLDSRAESDLDAPFSFPWPQPRPLSVAAAWVNGELTKNVSEIGLLRHTCEALTPPD